MSNETAAAILTEVYFKHVPQAGAVNIVGTTGLPGKTGGFSGVVDGNATILLDMNDASVTTLPHELTHVFRGDIYEKNRNPFYYNFNEIRNDFLEGLQFLGVPITSFQKGAKKFSVPPVQKANEPRQE